MTRRRVASAVAVLALISAPVAFATTPVTETFEPAADTTIYSSGETSNGAGNRIFAGVTGPNGGNTRQRSPMLFDLSAIPADAAILDVSLTVTLVQSNPITQTDDPFMLRRVLAPWGEAGSDGAVGGQGTIPEPGDATWGFAFFPDTPWATAGGDLAEDPSAELLIGRAPGSTWTFSDPALVKDVASWVAGTADNHGWILMGDESLVWTARKFGSREWVPGQRPVLSVTWEAGPACTGDFDGSGAIDFGDLLLLLADFGPCDGCATDLDGDASVTFDDLLQLLAGWGGCIG